MSSNDLVNREALRRALDENRLDALIAVYPKNVFYYSGSPVARGQLLLDYLPENPGRPTLSAVVVPRGGGNVLICAEEHEAVNRAEAWASQIRTYAVHRQSPMEGIVQAVKAAGLAGGRLGLEVTYLTVRYREELQRLLPQAELVPSDTQFEWIRALKTPREIEILKQAADLLDEAMLEAFSSARVGDTEWEVHCRILEGAERRGAEHCRGVLQAGETNIIRFMPAGPKRLGSGDIIHTDYAAFVHGYPSNLSRVGVVGEPTGLQRKIYANLIAGHRRIMEFMRPGVAGQEVYRFAQRAFADLGYLTTFTPILGHSLGLGYHERPILCAAETMRLETNMVFALEPRHHTHFHVQDQVLVGEYDTYLQSALFGTRDMFAIGS